MKTQFEHEQAEKTEGAEKLVKILSLTQTLLYLKFHLTLSGGLDLGRWSCPAACRRQGSGADELDTLKRWSLAKCVGSLSRWYLCPKLEPLMERPCKASSYLQEGARTL